MAEGATSQGDDRPVITKEDLALLTELGGENLGFAEDELTAEEKAMLDAMKNEEAYTPPEEREGAGEGEKAPEGEGAAAAAEGEGAPTEGEGEEGGKQGGRQSMVNHGALHAERERRKQEQAARQELEAKYNNLEGRFQQMLETIQGGKKDEGEEKKAEPEDPMPDPDEDIYAFAQWQQRENQRLREQVQETRETVQRTQTETQQTTELADMVSGYRTDAAAYAGENPAFAAAYQHLQQGRARELQAWGMSDPAAIAKQVQDEELALVASANQNGLRAPEMIYQMAIARGFDPQAVAPATGQTNADPEPQGAQAGRQPAAAPAQPAGGTSNGQGSTEQQASAADQVKALQEAKAATVSLSTAGGAAADTTSVEEVANMTPEQFDDFVKRYGMRAVEKLAGA